MFRAVTDALIISLGIGLLLVLVLYIWEVVLFKAVKLTRVQLRTINFYRSKRRVARWRERRLADVGCVFNSPWFGFCGNPTKESDLYCEHHKTKCVVCKERQATHGCTFASSMSCGAPLCDLSRCRNKHDSAHS